MPKGLGYYFNYIIPYRHFAFLLISHILPKSQHLPKLIACCNFLLASSCATLLLSISLATLVFFQFLYCANSGSLYLLFLCMNHSSPTLEPLELTVSVCNTLQQPDLSSSR